MDCCSALVCYGFFGCRSICDRTQFILITHRRGTMEEADVLYGVTMQEEGVSKLLSIDVSEIENKLGMKAST